MKFNCEANANTYANVYSDTNDNANAIIMILMTLGLHGGGNQKRCFPQDEADWEQSWQWVVLFNLD